jgi:two-component system chemotaxis response regulator CheY
MPTFVLVGHCGPDTYLLKNAITRAVPGASVVSADDPSSLASQVNSGGILLINRTLDGALGTDSGVELIAELAKSDAPPTMMLVSNYAGAQQDAIAAGALPGFGKRDVYAGETAARLLDAAARVASRSAG